MAGTKLIPERITSPFQLMAAWFAMLILLVSIILAAAINITTPDWAAAYLVIFSSVLIVLVLGCVTLMLTVFRPHLQEGKEYAQWLRDKNTYSSGILRSELVSAGPGIREEIKRQKVPKGKKNFSISVSNIPGARTLVDDLTKLGFSADIYRDTFDDEPATLDHHEAIWVGYAVPAKVAIESIKIAASHWPHLKYLHLSNDGITPPDKVHYQMFFGGASSTAKRYGLLPWSNKDLLGLDENMSQEEFHQAIREKY